MNQKGIFKLCKELGCCDSCCLRFVGARYHSAYENPKAYSQQFLENVNKPADTQPSSTADGKSKENKNESSSIIDESNDTMPQATTESPDLDINMEVTNSTSNRDGTTSNGETFPSNGQAVSSNGEAVRDRAESPQPKRRKVDTCVACLGLLQEDGWPKCNEVVKEVLDKKQYDCKSFGCGISLPNATMLREKVIRLTIKEAFPDFDEMSVTSLIKAWKCAYPQQLARHLGLALDSGAVCTLLVVLNMEYQDDQQELEALKELSPRLFKSRRRQRARFTVEFTRRSVEEALEGASLASLKRVRWGRAPPATGRATCVSVTCTREPMYLGGRYIKLSRELPQTPWIVLGKRMMESSVQEIIFEPIAKICGMTAADIDHRLKFISAGREDVDVRCLGDGRPFAIEITDPRRELTVDELKHICEAVSSGGKVVINRLVPVSKEDLTLLKAGEETKTKTYEALCIKLAHSSGSGLQTDEPITVTDEDISNINSYRNTPEGAPERIVVTQKTPIRVLHRRPHLRRTKYVLDLTAAKVPGHPQLVALRLRTSAGAYVKELVHGELRRTAPALAEAARAPLDLLALDVTAVQLHWPTK